ncbi:hypothetical protein [Dickeya phage Mysterion]|uniref:Uncharacterized protein n=1 Tax=Dickeya phage Mysterion TaxID=2320193 RepID=A0A385IGG6_9CAUD|nr:hypothetical protein HOU15_gp12 [Dickeya phage Mysterion]AXY81945.1 hypothetical protein [Dickeya phage Mysterion]
MGKFIGFIMFFLFILVIAAVPYLIVAHFFGWKAAFAVWAVLVIAGAIRKAGRG